MLKHAPTRSVTHTQRKLTIAALAGSAPACCVEGPGARSIHCGHFAVGHWDLVGVGLVTVGEKKKGFNISGRDLRPTAAGLCSALNQTYQLCMKQWSSGSWRYSNNTNIYKCGMKWLTMWGYKPASVCSPPRLPSVSSAQTETQWIGSLITKEINSCLETVWHLREFSLTGSLKTGLKDYKDNHSMCQCVIKCGISRLLDTSHW